MAVHARYRHRGIGRALVDRLGRDLRAEGRRLLLVLTVSPSDPGREPPDGYRATRAFYRTMGFVLARDLPGLWPNDTAVLLVKPLDTGPANKRTEDRMGTEEDMVGQASGWSVDEDEGGGFRWAAYGPAGTAQGQAATREEAERAAMRAEQDLIRRAEPPPRTTPTAADPPEA
jgi:Acetyltransferase (GNAT) domain